MAGGVLSEYPLVWRHDTNGYRPPWADDDVVALKELANEVMKN
jgi:hypothetical protein